MKNDLLDLAVIVLGAVLAVLLTVWGSQALTNAFIARGCAQATVPTDRCPTAGQ